MRGAPSRPLRWQSCCDCVDPVPGEHDRVVQRIVRSGAGRAVDAVWGVLLRRPALWLAIWSVLLIGVQGAADSRSMSSWFYIVRGVHTILGPQPLSLFAMHPELQMGPLAFVLSAPFVLLPHPAGTIAAAVMMQGAGLLAVLAARGLLRPSDRFGDRRWFAGAVITMAAWTELAVRYGHADDVLALLGGVLALRLLHDGAVLRAALLIGLAVDCKPWIAPLAFVLLMAPRRRWLPAASVVVLVVAAVWVPFFIDPHWVRALRFTIAVDPTATIRLLGLADARTPAWCRPAQILLGAGAVALAARRGRPESTLLLVVVTRLLLDPGAHLYYAAGAVLGGCLLDLTAVVPVAASLALLGLELPPYVFPFQDLTQAVIRVVTLGLLGVLAIAGPRRRSAVRVGASTASSRSERVVSVPG